jgi:hypothetical protein
MEIEQFRFWMWTVEFSKLENATGVGNPSDIAIKKPILQEIESLLPRGKRFQERYKLKVEETDENVETRVNRGWPRLPCVLQRKFDTMVAEVIHSRNGTLKKLRWAAFDKISMTELVQDINVQISSLLEMTSLGIQRKILRVVLSMVRSGIKTSIDADDLDFLSQLSFPPATGPDSQWEIAEASHLSGLKSRRIALRVDTTGWKSKSSSRFPENHQPRPG